MEPISFNRRRRRAREDAKEQMLPAGCVRTEENNVIEKIFHAMDNDHDGVLTKKEVLKALYFGPEIADLVHKVDSLSLLLRPSSFEDAFMSKDFSKGKHELTKGEFMNYIHDLLDEADENFQLPPETTEIPLVPTNQEHSAATSVQSIFRGRKARKKQSQLKEQKEENSAATKVQARIRGRQARAMAGRAEIRRMAESKAATKVQAMIRGRLARRCIGLGSQLHKEWLQMMSDKQVSRPIELSHLKRIVRYMKLQGDLNEGCMENILEAFGSSTKMTYSEYAAFSSRHRQQIMNGTAGQWKQKKRIKRSQIKVNSAIDAWRKIKRKLEKGWDFQAVNLTFDSEAARKAYSISYEEKYRKNIILKSIKRAQFIADEAAEALLSRKKHAARKAKQLLGEKIEREKTREAADRKRKNWYRRHNLYNPRESGMAKRALSKSVSSSIIFSYQYKEERFELCINLLLNFLSENKSDNDDDMGKCLLKVVNKAASSYELAVEEVPEVVFHSFDRAFQWAKQDFTGYISALQKVFHSGPAQKKLMDCFALKHFKEGSDETIKSYVDCLTDLLCARILEYPHAQAWALQNSDTRKRGGEEDLDLPIYTDKEVLFGQEDACSLLNNAIRVGKSHAITALRQCKDRAATHLDSKTVGVPLTIDPAISEWHSPKTKRSKTPMFPEWSPYSGRSDESKLLSRSGSLLSLPKVPSGTKPWNLEKGEKVKLLSHTGSSHHSSSQEALKIYTQVPRSPTYPSSPKSMSPKKKDAKYTQRKEAKITKR